MMQSLNFAQIRWKIGQLIKKIGLLGILALAITLGCCLFYTIYVNELKQKIEDNSLMLAQAKQQESQFESSEKLQANIQPEQTHFDEIKRFYAQFPVGESLPNCLRLIDNIALKQRLTLNRGDYKLTQIKQLQTNQGALARYEIILPVTGQYAQIRQFIAQVLHELPALALTDVQLKRESAQSPTVEARLIFVLLLKNKSGGGAWQ